MSPLLRISIRLAIIFVIIFFAIQPFNWFCQITQKCNPFFFSYYIPKSKGTKPLSVAFEVMNYRENIDFFPEEQGALILANEKHSVIYHLKNNSKKIVTVRPQLIVKPEPVEKHLIRYQCLCFKQYSLKPGEEIKLKMEFEIDKDVETDPDLDLGEGSQIAIRFKI